MTFLITLFFILSLLSLAYFKLPAKRWVPAAAVLLVLYSWLPMPGWLVSLAWLLMVPVMLLFSISTLRQQYLTGRVMQYFQRALPTISDTEQAALDAGDVGWEQQVFCGRPDWSQLKTFPSATLDQREQAFLDNQVNTLCSMLNGWQMARQHGYNLPPQAWDYLKKERFFGLQIAQEHGGHGFSVWGHSAVISRIASRDPSAAVMVMVPNSVGPAELIQHFGTQEQRQQYLPRLARGEDIPAFALTGPDAGSDASAMTDTGIVCHGTYEGKTVLGMRLNWNKRYITLAPVATLLGLAFKLYDPEHLLSEQEDIGITVAVLPTHLAGVEVGPRHLPAGLSFLNGTTRGKDVFVPLDCIVGGAEMRGKGWQMLMHVLAEGRGISLPALSSASAALSYRMTGAYAQLREQFRLPIGQFEGVAQRLGHIAGLTYLADATRCLTLAMINQGLKPALAAAISKYHVTELGRKVVLDAMDIHGGHAIQQGPHNYLGLIYQSLPIAITVEGANILTRNLMIFGQGALRCHPYIQAEIAAIKQSDAKQRLRTFDQLFCRHLGYIAANTARTVIDSLTAGRLIRVTSKPALKHSLQQLTRMSTAFAFTVDIIFALVGKQLKRQEALSARLGDVLSHLYMASAVVYYHQQQGEPTEDQHLINWTLEYCLYEIHRAFSAVFDNLKPRWAGKMLYRVIFPWGNPYHYPRDELTHRIARDTMCSSVQRDRITQCCYINKAADDATGRIELALQALEQSHAARQRLTAAIKAGQITVAANASLPEQCQAAHQAGILSADEVQLITEFFTLRANALRVDEFPLEFFTKDLHHVKTAKQPV